jgi:acyl-CoA thioesterase FadM
MKNSSLVFNYEILAKDKLLATGESTHVFTNRSGRPVRIPEAIRALSR